MILFRGEGKGKKISSIIRHNQLLSTLEAFCDMWKRTSIVQQNCQIIEPSTYNTRHKSLKQEPLILNFLQIFYIHTLHPCSHSDVPLSFPNVEPSVFWSTEMTSNPNQHWGGENHSSVSRFVTSIVVQLPESFFLLFGAEGNSKLFTLLTAGEQEDLWYSGMWMAWLVRAASL